MNHYKKAALIMGTVASLGMMAPPAHAQTLLERWFPGLFKKEISDAVPLQGGKVAPFQNSAPVIDPAQSLGEEYRADDGSAGTATPAPKLEYAPPKDAQSAVDMDQAHRQPGQMTEWVSKAVADALDFDPLTFEAHLKEQSIVLTPYALESLRTFMAKDNLLAALQSNDLVMRAFVTDASRVLNQGAIQGRFRWLLETPVTISFMPRGISDYTNIKPKSQRINVRTQVGRVEQGGDDGVMIETIEFLPATSTTTP